jgi:hypothetical protein
MQWTMVGDKPAKELNLNDRNGTHYQRVELQARKALWRDGTFWLANRGRKPKITGKATMVVEFGTDRPNQRRDPHNFMPTCKAICDGVVLAGLLGDDDTKHLAMAEPRFVTDLKPTQFRVTITWENEDAAHQP